MFNKLYKKMDDMRQVMKDNFGAQANEHYNTRSLVNKLSSEYKSKLDNMYKTISSQQHTIEQLTNALQGKYERGLFIFSEDCKTPIVIRNGEQVISKYTRWFRIEWVPGEAPHIETEQLVESFSEE